MYFEIMRLMLIHSGSNWTICASGGFGLLQIVLEPDTGWCACEDVGSLRGVNCEIHIGWGGVRNITYKGVKISPW